MIGALSYMHILTPSNKKLRVVYIANPAFIFTTTMCRKVKWKGKEWLKVILLSLMAE